MVNATTITATTPAGRVGMASALARTLGGAKAANTLFTYVTPAPTVTITGTNPSGARHGGGAPLRGLVRRDADAGRHCARKRIYQGRLSIGWHSMPTMALSR
jgi:hypothetical protein